MIINVVAMKFKLIKEFQLSGILFDKDQKLNISLRYKLNFNH